MTKRITANEQPTIFVDADGCPVKEEVYRVARKYGVKVYVVCNSYMKVPADPWIKHVVVGRELDAADIWVAEHVGAGDVVVTNDIPLADRCLKHGARVLDDRGREFNEDSIGTQMATRDLMNDLRLMGLTTGGPPPFVKKDRSQFLAKLHEIIQALLRAARP